MNGLKYALFDLQLLDFNNQKDKVKAQTEKDLGFDPSYSFGEATSFGSCLEIFSVAI